MRRGAGFARELELEVAGYVEIFPQGSWGEAGERLLHVMARAHNVGGARVEIESATLEVFPRLLREEEPPQRSRELAWDEPDIYEAFPGGAPPRAYLVQRASDVSR